MSLRKCELPHGNMLQEFITHKILVFPLTGGTLNASDEIPTNSFPLSDVLIRLHKHEL